MTGTINFTDVDLDIASGILNDSSNAGKSTTVVVNGTWTLTGNSNVDKVTIAKGGVINQNGYTLSYSTISNNGTLN